MFDGYDDRVGSGQSRNRGGGCGGARSCSVSVLPSLFKINSVDCLGIRLQYCA